ncbi:hypothetical protein CMI37_11990, partial [Candidatus Pacearchaeota archaeon]|nr:hypothetical protein [Candidatus Pacearchaeota archaeon]
MADATMQLQLTGGASFGAEVAKQLNTLAQRAGGGFMNVTQGGFGPKNDEKQMSRTMGALGSIVNQIPGGGFFTDIGKAFKSGGLFVGVLAGIGSLVSIVKSGFGASQIWGTMSQTFFKTMGMLVDMMLMPMMPYMMKGLQWLLSEGPAIAKQLSSVLVFFAKIIEGINKFIPFATQIQYILGAWFAAWTFGKINQLTRGGLGRTT